MTVRSIETPVNERSQATPPGDYLKPEVIRKANEILRYRKEAARLKYAGLMRNA